MPRSSFGPQGLGANVAHGGVELVQQEGEGLPVAEVRPEVLHALRRGGLLSGTVVNRNRNRHRNRHRNRNRTVTVTVTITETETVTETVTVTATVIVTVTEPYP